MRLALNLALGIAFGVALIPVVWRVVRLAERGAARLWRSRAGAIVAASVAGIGIALVATYLVLMGVRYSGDRKVSGLRARLAADTECTALDRSHICSGDEWETANRRRDSLAASIAAVRR